MGLYDKFDDNASVAGARNDFPTCTVWGMCDAVKQEQTDAGMAYVKAYWTVIKVQAGEDTSQGQQHTHAIFKGKHKFFEKDTKKLAGRLIGLTSVKEIDALQGARDPAKKKVPSQVEKILHHGGAEGVVLRIVAKAIPADEENDKKGFTRVDYGTRVSAEEIKAALSKKEIKKFFPNGMDEEGRAIGHTGDQAEEETEEEEAEEEAEEEEEETEEEEEEETEEEETEEEEEEEEEPAPPPTKKKSKVKVKGKK